MIEWLLNFPAPITLTEEEQADIRSLVLLREIDGAYWYDCLAPTDPTTTYPVLAGGTIVGAWDADGVLDPAYPVSPAFTLLCPLGNLPDGTATGVLKAHHYQGWLQRHLGDEAATDELAVLYPAAVVPLAIEIRHKEFFGTWSGWGWRAEILGGSDVRDPSVRAIGVYTDPECTQYEYTTGAFVIGESDWQVDDEGAPLLVWYTETPPGFATPDKPDWYLAVLYASIQEGHQTLAADEDAISHLYWPIDQPPVTTGTWVDTGETVTGMAGTVTLVSSVSPFSVGSMVRIEGYEMEVTSIWADQGLVLDPYRASSMGAAIEILQ